MPRLLADEVKICDSQETGFRAGDVFLRPIFARVQESARNRELRVFRGFAAIKTPSNRLQAG